MKKLVIIAALLMAGCQSTVPTTKLQVVTPPDQMYDCPIKDKWPNWQKLNDTDVAKTDRKSTRLNSSHSQQSRMPSSA